MNADKQQEFFEAVKANDRATVRQLFEQHPELINVRNEAGISAVLLTIYHHHLDLARELAESKELDISEAAAIGNAQRVAQLLEQNPSLINEYSPDGFPALGYAAYFGHPETLALLLERGADPNQQAKNAMLVRPIHAALAHPDARTALTMAERLLRAGADVNAKQQGGWMALHAAAANGNIEMIHLLLRCRADINAKNDDGKTAFAMATEKGHTEAAALLNSA